MIEQSSIDGVHTLFSQRPGPPLVGLSFRVGTADEALPTRGITHMVEHLALHRAGLTDYHANGQTGASVTTFYVGGSVDRVREFIETVCTSLNDLPVDRLALERGVISTEEAGRSLSDQALWRHGAQGYGMSSYPEWGVRSITAAQLQAWAAEWFTAENAVLWMTGESIPDLAVSLPHGSRKPLPELTSVLPQTPAFYAYGRRRVAFDMLVKRSTAAQTFAGVLERRLYESMRVESGISYGIGVGYEPITADLAGISGSCDALEESEGALVGQFIDTLASIEAGKYDDKDVEAVKTRAREGWELPDLDARRLPGVAQDVLFGASITPIEEFRAKLDAVSVDDVRKCAEEALGTLLLKIPFGTSARGGGLAEAPLCSEHRVTGSSYPSRTEAALPLVLAVEGVTLESEEGPATVLFSEVEAMLTWPDGAVQLIGRDGIAVRVEPQMHGLNAESMAWLHDRIPNERYVSMPAREPDQIPQPTVHPVPTSVIKPARGGLIRRRTT